MTIVISTRKWWQKFINMCLWLLKNFRPNIQIRFHVKTENTLIKWNMCYKYQLSFEKPPTLSRNVIEQQYLTCGTARTKLDTIDVRKSTLCTKASGQVQEIVWKAILFAMRWIQQVRICSCIYAEADHYNFFCKLLWTFFAMCCT